MTAALEFLAALSALVLYVSYKLENRRRDQLYGKPDPDAPVDTTVLADKVCHPSQCTVGLANLCRRNRLPTSAIRRKAIAMQCASLGYEVERLYVYLEYSATPSLVSDPLPSRTPDR